MAGGPRVRILFPPAVCPVRTGLPRPLYRTGKDKAFRPWRPALALSPAAAMSATS